MKLKTKNSNRKKHQVEENLNSLNRKSIHNLVKDIEPCYNMEVPSDR